MTMRNRLRNARLSREEVRVRAVHENVMQILEDVYNTAIQRWKERFVEKQKLQNDLQFVKRSGRKTRSMMQTYVVFVQTLSGQYECASFPGDAQYPDLYSRSRKIFGVPKHVSIRLFFDVPWIGGYEDEALPSRSFPVAFDVWKRSLKMVALS